MTQIAAIARNQLEAARTGDWATVAELTDQRERLVTQFETVLATYTPIGSERKQIVALAVEIQALDTEIMERVETETRRIAEEIDETRRARSAADAYERTIGAARRDLVSQYG